MIQRRAAAAEWQPVSAVILGGRGGLLPIGRMADYRSTHRRWRRMSWPGQRSFTIDGAREFPRRGQANHLVAFSRRAESFMPRLSGIHLIGFKRFNDLTINDIPPSARLVVLAGPNGRGKSSLFDAFRLWSSKNSGRGWKDDPDYYSRAIYESGTKSAEPQTVTLTFSTGPVANGSDVARKAFYIRSAYRNDPDLSIGSLSKVGSALVEDRLFRMIENDVAVTKNYQRLVSDAFDDAFEKEPETTTFQIWREKVIGDLRDAIARLFPGLILNGLGSPLRDPTFRFTKGSSQRFLYKNLSGGEKAAFDLILDFIVKRREYDDTIFCIDEPEVHLNPRIHGRFVKELLLLMPPNCQLWIATHAIGMMREARDIEREMPGSVAFLDFGAHDFDQPVTLTPTKPTRAFWESALSVALHDLAELVAPQKIVVCEGLGREAAGKNAEHDARCYTTIFGDEFPDTVFISGGNSTDVATDRIGFTARLPAIVQGSSVHRLIDRDDHSLEDIAEYNRKGITVLGRRNLESYLWDNEVLKALCSSREQEEALRDVLQNKDLELQKSVDRGNAPNDLKSAAPNMFAYIRRRLTIVGEANDSRAFERNVLAKLLKPDMAVFRELKSSIFD